ncbi:hypothetical protein [Mycobacterium sp.]|uniref:hypothetical protein n=1 Tax=Mycobacterium sp. TaxID=1785 RepID=UPI002C50B09D|nr:hypothetical protein [Mycobacterium sp.]HTQ19586.1 hypothetical protein [Mycobacterium sp.]
MLRKARVRFWIEVILAAVTAALLLLTLISREWIEEVFGVEPDAGSGALEWAIVVALAVATVAFSLLARAEWKRAVALRA